MKKIGYLVPFLFAIIYVVFIIKFDFFEDNEIAHLGLLFFVIVISNLITNFILKKFKFITYYYI
ncbi:hypothetical protein Halha_1943 [Halobacteroides halobius DSM 5150]|uniref:Uncharacterized protein n=1 Tax=Halobacteroides halobius (strain ATCC 35273 / DSM 5150 / MD-1) TaxID=748449 RepID=L0KA29_HALHC|nr:hypothetical protein [Halobacteroides halobius]AGB41851.1 hypothetical protein Halha_1943 [Halobacteroides halobius DSM 5150]